MGYLIIVFLGIYLVGIELTKKNLYSKKDIFELNEIEPEIEKLGIKDIIAPVISETIKGKVISETVKVIKEPVKTVSQIKSITSKTIQTTEKVLQTINSNISGIASNVLLPLGLTYGIYRLGVNLEPRYDVGFLNELKIIKSIKDKLVIEFDYEREYLDNLTNDHLRRLYERETGLEDVEYEKMLLEDINYV